MKFLIKKDLKNREKYFNKELNQKIVLFSFRNFLNEINQAKEVKRKFYISFISSFSKFKSKTKIVRRCVLTGRSRSSLRFTGISRIKMRELIRDRKIKNIVKQSW